MSFFKHTHIFCTATITFFFVAGKRPFTDARLTWNSSRDSFITDNVRIGFISGGLGGMGFGAYSTYENRDDASKSLTQVFTSGLWTISECGTIGAIGCGCFVATYPFAQIAIGLCAIASFAPKEQQQKMKQ